MRKKAASNITVRGLMAVLAWSTSACKEDDEGQTSGAAQTAASTAQANATAGNDAVKAATSEVAYIVLRVTDLPRSEAFYRDVLGMQEAFRYEIGNGAIEVALGYPNAAGMVTGAAIVLLYQPNRADPFAHGTSYNRYVLAVPDVEATFQHLAELGISGLSMPVRYEQFKAIVGFATDPDGYTIEILQRI
jgi:catechol 2,3-dioxygenase-like lactoylglutathione lyase family enzyme